MDLPWPNAKKNVVHKMFGSKEIWSTKIKATKKLGAKSLVQIKSVTIDILLIWTNDAMTYNEFLWWWVG